MKVLFAVSECVPFIKSGGLADVAGSLPKELKKLGTDIRVMMPKYGSDFGRISKRNEKNSTNLQFDVGWRKQYCAIEEYVYQDVIYYFVDNEHYFNRDHLIWIF